MEEKNNVEEEEDENLLEDADYSKKSDFNKASVVQSAVDKVKEMRAKEMRTGYYNTMTRPDGSIKKQYIEDTRKSYFGAVEYLRQVLSHEIATEERMKKVLKEFNLRKKALFNKYAVQVLRPKGRDLVLSELYIPDMDEVIPVMNGYNSPGQPTRNALEGIKGRYNWEVNRYWDEMIDVYDYLFSELNILIALKDYFKQKTGY